MENKPGASAPKNPTQRMLDQFGRVTPTPEQAKLVEHIRDEFVMLATICANRLPDGAEKTVALRKLLEGKDAAVRAVLFS